MMGEKKRRQAKTAAMLTEHSRCIYCGEAATTVDHCPPRCFFLGRQWPEGYAFPACGPCNAEARLDEQALGVLVRINLSDNNDPRKDQELKRLLEGTSNNFPEIVREWKSTSRSDIRKALRSAFPDIGDDLRRAGYGAVHLGPLSKAAIKRFMIKLGKAVYYRQTGKILDGYIIAHHIDFAVINNKEDALDRMLQFAPALEATSRAQRSLSDQFVYRFNASEELGALNLVARFSDQFVFHILAVRGDTYARLLADTEESADQQARSSVVDCRLATNGDDSMLDSKPS